MFPRINPGFLMWAEIGVPRVEALLSKRDDLDDDGRKHEIYHAKQAFCIYAAYHMVLQDERNYLELKVKALPSHLAEQQKETMREVEETLRKAADALVDYGIDIEQLDKALTAV